VDEKSLKMVQCDFARVRILTSEKKIIDSSMAVKVLGVRFDIRVMEESGGWTESCGGFAPKLCENAGESSSHAPSDGGNSVVAAVEGLSESGSDADVSESCQILMDVEKRGGGRQVGDLGMGGYNVCTVSEENPNLLGMSGKVVAFNLNKWFSHRLSLLVSFFCCDFVV
jgi:hypothetical protein